MFEEASYVGIEWEGRSEWMQAGICDRARARSEDPAGIGIGVKGEMERSEFGHEWKRVCECAVKGAEGRQRGVDCDRESAHEAGDRWFLGEGDDDGKVTVGRRKDEVTVEDALYIGIKDGVSARKDSEVGSGKVSADRVEEFDG
jgi:hypothetical protein